ncbi:MAG: hypothetical protein KDJ47_01665 [Hyphomicrobiaceae bacterium]|nr:hypothetical protein [Hyphomicrobiaceae bacterium]
MTRKSQPYRIFKLSVSSCATVAERLSTTSEGPFVIRAQSPSMARMLVSLNFSKAKRRGTDTRISSTVWSDCGANECVEVTDWDHQRPPILVEGVDISRAWLDTDRIETSAGCQAEMLWWPTGVAEECPV